MMTSVDLRGDRIVIKREIRSGEYETITLTFAEVRMAAEVLREHLLALTPPEIPAEPEPIGPLIDFHDGKSLICQKCGKPVIADVCRRVRVNSYTGQREYIPGGFHRECVGPLP